MVVYTAYLDGVLYLYEVYISCMQLVFYNQEAVLQNMLHISYIDYIISYVD